MKNIIPIIFSILSFGMFFYQYDIPMNDFITWIILVVLFIFFFNIKLYDKKYFFQSIIISTIFSFLITFGKNVYINMANNKVSVFREFIDLSNILSFLGLCVLLFSIFINILPKLYKYDIFAIKGKKLTNKKVFIISMIIIFLCWFPYFLSLYPGELSSDSITEIATFVNNFKNLSNHHPVIHMLFVYIPYNLIYNIFGNANLAVASSTLLQMLIMASIFSYMIMFLHKKNIKINILILCLIYFSLVPVHAFYSVTMWKDIIFSGLILLLVIELIKIYEKKDVLQIKNLIWFIIISILMLFFRNNAIYMYFILIIFILLFFRKKFYVFLTSFIIVIGVYFVITYPLFNALNIKRSSSSEYIAIPLQQIGRMVYKDVKLNKEEKKLNNDLIGVEELKKSYNPYSVDTIKFNKNYDAKVFDKNKSKYLKLWFNLVIKNPTVAIESYAVSTLGYWYPNVDNWVICDGIYANNLGIYRQPKVTNVLGNIINKMDSKNIALFGMFWSTSLSFYLIVIFGLLSVKKNNLQSLVFYIPVFGIWLTMMIASPVNSEFRYIYPSYTCLPILIIIPYLFSKKKIKR